MSLRLRQDTLSRLDRLAERMNLTRSSALLMVFSEHLPIVEQRHGLAKAA